jgi:hypothetical protein
MGEPDSWQGEIIFGSQVSAIGYLVRVFWFGYGYRPEPVPGAEYPNPGPDGRDLGPENEIPVSGFPLSECIVSGGRWQPRVAGGGLRCLSVFPTANR